MPSDDYTLATSGALKLKSVDSSSKVHKRKKKRPKSTAPPPQTVVEEAQVEDGPASEGKMEESKTGDENDADMLESSEKTTAKTEAELHFEEMRRKRLNDKLKKEGTKTHKERVEELNRYLNKLSEHHDMYVQAF